MSGFNQPEEIADVIEVLSDHGFIVEEYESRVDFQEGEHFYLEDARIVYLEERDKRET